MNIFIAYIDSGRAATESELRKLFWALAKKTHPDAAGIESGGGAFRKIKSDYDDSLGYLKKKKQDPARKKQAGETQRITKDECVDIFLELIASNFPVDRSIRDLNSAYMHRIELLNAGIASLDPTRKDLFLAFERELYALRGDSVVSNHPYGMVKLYLYRYLDYRQFPSAINRRFVLQNFDPLVRLFEEKDMRASVSFMRWLLDRSPSPAPLRGSP